MEILKVSGSGVPSQFTLSAEQALCVGESRIPLLGDGAESWQGPFGRFDVVTIQSVLALAIRIESQHWQCLILTGLKEHLHKLLG